LKTPLQFDGHDAGGADATLLASMKICGTCGSRFSGDARFCPFDGEPLRLALESEHVEDPLLGTVVDDRYEVSEVLGEGGMGTVYRVRHRILERPFALKVLRADLSRDSDLGVRFTREAKAAASISHPNVVQITDFGSLPSGQPYFVMELLVGESVNAVIGKGGPLPAARAVRMLLQIVDALAAAHAAGIVHRDLKPDNIFVCQTPSGEELVKVLDFGLAKVAGQSRLTKAGLVFGTPHYMSPEQASGGTIDERTDLYALGVVMYEMFTGRVPFEADTYMGVLTKHLYVEPTPPSVLLGEPAELGALEQVILRCLEKKPEKRYESMAALAAELKRVASFSDIGELRVRPAEIVEPRERHRLADDLELPTAGEVDRALGKAGLGARPVPMWVAAGAALAGFALITILLIAISSRSPEPSEPRPAESVAGPAPSFASVAEPRPRTATQALDRPTPIAGTMASGRVPDGGGAATTASESSEAASRSTARTKAKSSKAARPATAPSAAGAARNPSTGKQKMVGGDIIDPWSR
jgi:eukaryotic-like serine/threonine-protein kinase